MFEVEECGSRWTVFDGTIRFGPYATRARAESSARSLNAQRAWLTLPPVDRLERLLAECR